MGSKENTELWTSTSHEAAHLSTITFDNSHTHGSTDRLHAGRDQDKKEDGNTTIDFKSARGSVALKFLTFHCCNIKQLAVKAGMFHSSKTTGCPSYTPMLAALAN